MTRHCIPVLALFLVLLLAACSRSQDPTTPVPASSETSEETTTVPATTEAPPAYAGKYRLSPDGEAIVDDVSPAGPVNDNARVFYEIFVGSFSDSDGDGTGDLRGIINRMDYLNDGQPDSGLSLGVEGIWLTPIFTSPSYHKYNVTDYYQIDPKFGTMDDLKALIALCHERNVKLILDLPINHTGSMNSWFNQFVVAQRQKKTDDPYYDFYSYYRQGQTAPAGRVFAPMTATDIFYECNFSGDMPELNFDNEGVRQAVLDVAKFYLDMGIDGFRFDAAKYLYLGEHGKNVEFWTWYMAELKKIKPDVYAIAEVWDGDGITDTYYPALDCFNFSTAQAEGFIADTAKAGNVNAYMAYLSKYLKTIGSMRDDALLHEFISNHDTDRSAGYLTVASGQMMMAANLYLLTPGSPFIYYGEEIGLKGSRGAANTDANRRLAMRWGDEDTVKNPEGSSYEESNQVNGTVAGQIGQESSLYTHYKRLLMIRRAHPAIARGSFTPLSLSGMKAGGFIASYEGETVCVLHNTSRGSAEIALSQLSASYDFSVMAEVIGLGEARIENGVLILSGQTSVILTVK